MAIDSFGVPSFNATAFGTRWVYVKFLRMQVTVC